MHVVEDYKEITIILQVEVLLGDPHNEFLHA
jgi:hypothetical protein